MKRNGLLLMAGLVFLGCVATPLYAAEAMPESRRVYRETTLNSLVTESKIDRKFPRRASNLYSHNPSDYFTYGEDSLFVLEPAEASYGVVVGA